MMTTHDVSKTAPSSYAGRRPCALLGAAMLLCAACGSNDTSSSGASWPGLGSLDCSLLDSGLPAKLIVDYAGSSRTISASVYISLGDAIGVRVSCINPNAPSESLAAALDVGTDNDVVVGTYSISTPSRNSSRAAKGELELDEVDGQFEVTRASQGVSTDPADWERRNDAWKGRYVTSGGLPPSDAARARYDFTDLVSYTVTSIVELPKAQQTVGTGKVLRTHEVHGSIDMDGMRATSADGSSLDTDGRAQIHMRAEF